MENKAGLTKANTFVEELERFESYLIETYNLKTERKHK